MTFSAAFAIVQWGVILPVQVYFVWRSYRNYKESERELLEARDLNRKALEVWTEALTALQSTDPLQDERQPPTVQ